MRTFDVELFVGRPWNTWEIVTLTVDCEFAASAGSAAETKFWEVRAAALGDHQMDPSEEIAFIGVYSVTETEEEEEED